MVTKEERELDQITDELVHKLKDKRSRWSELYQLIARVEACQLWKSRFKSMTKWLEDLARKAGCQIQYLWRVKKAGKFYSAYAEAEAAAGREAASVEDCGLGDEMLADIDRISEGKPEKAREYIGAAMAGELTKSKVKEMVRTTAGARAKAKGKPSPKHAAPEGGADGATASDLLLALTPEVFYSSEQLGKHLLHGERRVWRVFSEFRVETGTSAHARRMDALVVSNAADKSQYDVCLDMVEIKVTESDLERDTKHLEYEPYADRCWFCVPESLSFKAEELAPEGWGVLVWSPVSKAVRVTRQAEVRRGLMRAVTLSTALVKSLPNM